MFAPADAVTPELTVSVKLFLAVTCTMYQVPPFCHRDVGRRC